MKTDEEIIKSLTENMDSSDFLEQFADYIKKWNTANSKEHEDKSEKPFTWSGIVYDVRNFYLENPQDIPSLQLSI